MSTYRITKLHVQESCSTLPAMVGQHDKLYQRAVGARLKALFTAKGWTAVTFAGMLGRETTDKHLGNWTSGRHLVPVWAATQAGTLTGVDIRYIYHGTWPSDADPDFVVKVNKALELIERPESKPKRRSRRG